MIVTFGSGLLDALGGGGVTLNDGCGSGVESARERADSPIPFPLLPSDGEGDLGRLRVRLLSRSCRLPDCGLTSFEKNPGAI
jgi:hypothetical protein